jgi:hypothetical protein
VIAASRIISTRSQKCIWNTGSSACYTGGATQSYNPGDLVRYGFTFGNDSHGGLVSQANLVNISNPTFADLLPLGVDYDGTTPPTFNVSAMSGAVAGNNNCQPVIQAVPNFQ